MLNAQYAFNGVIMKLNIERASVTLAKNQTNIKIDMIMEDGQIISLQPVDLS